ncbi:MAG: DinB family protein [Thermomicrobiales bacterium]
MHVADLRALYDYSCWMNDRILDTAGQVTPEQYTAPTDLTPRNLQDNLVHILDVEWSWRETVRTRGEKGVGHGEILEPADFPDVASLRARWAVESEIMREYLAGLSDEDLDAPARPGDDRFSIGDILFHAINHGLLARVEAAVLLTSYGHSPGDLDYLDFIAPVSS